MCKHNKLTHKVLSISSGVESSALSEQLAGFLLSQVRGHNKELGVQSCFSRLPDCRGTQGNQTVGLCDDDDGDDDDI